MSEAVLDILRNVRAVLHKALPQEFGLSLSFPIEDASSEMASTGCHGLTDIEYKWEPSRRQSSSLTVRRVAVAVFDPTQPTEPLPIELLLLTFIHELAHTVTQAELVPIDSVTQTRSDVEGSFREKLVVVHHSKPFYEHYATLLKAAEKLGVLTIPSVPNKYSEANLQRLDSIDVTMSKAGLNRGVSPMYSKMPPKVRVSLTAKSAQSRVVVLEVEGLSLKTLLQVARSKLRLSAKSCKEVHSAQQNPEGTLIGTDSCLQAFVASSIGSDIVLTIK